ncbi:hypothetical protein BH20ACT4_BH20ACT4_09930 [soil metagenome]
MLDVPAALLAERQRLGLDRFDEMWEGELHMVPPPSAEHQRIGTKLVAALFGVAEAARLRLSYETGVFDPKATGNTNYRTPDLVVFDDAASSERGVEGRARLVVEIRSPGDESLAKLTYYESVGVSEVILIDRDSKAVRHWLASDQGLLEAPPSEDGWHHLQALPARLRTIGTRLELDAGGAVIVI